MEGIYIYTLSPFGKSCPGRVSYLFTSVNNQNNTRYIRGRTEEEETVACLWLSMRCPECRESLGRRWLIYNSRKLQTPAISKTLNVSLRVFPFFPSAGLRNIENIDPPPIAAYYELQIQERNISLEIIYFSSFFSLRRELLLRLGCNNIR